MKTEDRPEVLVIGDAIWDRYLTVEPKENPEGDYPAYRTVAERGEPGGALNASECVRRMGGRVLTITPKTSSTKTRIKTPEGRRLSRFDQDQWGEIDHESLPRDFGAVLFSDYGKGACSEAVVRKLANAARVVVVDPHVSTPLDRWVGVGIVKFNRTEAEYFLGQGLPTPNAALKGASQLRQRLRAEVVIITLGADGVVWSKPEPGLLTAHNVPVADVVGAGDAFAAALVLQLTRGRDFLWAISYATAAAAASVQGEGCSPPLHRDVNLVSLGCPVPSKRLLLTNGCFDHFHVGHLETLEWAVAQKAAGDCLLVAVNDDRSVEELKGSGRPLWPLNRRLASVGHTPGVDCVIPFNGNLAALISQLRPEVLIKGGTTKAVVGAELVERYGGVVMRGPLIPGVSTSGIAAAQAR